MFWQTQLQYSAHSSYIHQICTSRYNTIPAPPIRATARPCARYKCMYVCMYVCNTIYETTISKEHCKMALPGSHQPGFSLQKSNIGLRTVAGEQHTSQSEVCALK